MLDNSCVRLESESANKDRPITNERGSDLKFNYQINSILI